MKKEVPYRWGVKVNPKLKDVISYCKKRGNALDLGCGLGANSKYLIQQGFFVSCVDSNQSLLEKLKKDFKKNKLFKKAGIIHANIENFIPVKKYDLILAISVLHFLKLEIVKNIMIKMKKSLRRGGIIFIRAFSNKDDDFKRLKKKGLQSGINEIFSPKLNKSIHYFNKKETQDILKGFEMIKIEEYRRCDKHPPVGVHNHYVFDVIVRKK